LLFSASILLNNQKIYFLPSFFAAFIFVIFISILSIVAAAINYKLRAQVLEKSIEAKNYLDNASEGIFRISLIGKIMSANSAFVKLLSFTSESQLIQNMNFKELFNKSNDYEKLHSEVLEKGNFRDKEIVLINYFKQKLSVILNARHILDTHGKVIAIEGSILDITERVEATKKVKEYNYELKKLNATKDKFFSILAHDLLSPFTSLLGYSELLNNEVESLSKQEIREFAGDINLVAHKSHNLLENLLSWSSIQSDRIQFRPKTIALHPIVEDIILLSRGNANSKEITLFNEVNKEVSVFADFNMLNAILRNLISNAIKFTNSGGKISVGVDEIDDYYELSVADTGVGMTEEDKNKLFKIDVHHSEIGTNNEKGTGLGLVLCAEFVAKHGGKISVDTHLGIGSKFIFTLKKNLVISQ
jgi:PAS domain S-box-containing protein